MLLLLVSRWIVWLLGASCHFPMMESDEACRIVGCETAFTGVTALVDKSLSNSSSSSMWWKVTDRRFPTKDLALVWAGYPEAFSEILGRFLCGEKSVADFERR